MAVHDLITDPALRTRDLAALGLGSLDWISLATQIEHETGVELPDNVLLDAKHRTVAGWAAVLTAASAA